MLNGLIVIGVTDYQAAVEYGGNEYQNRYGVPPTMVALPSSVDPATLDLWTLELSAQPAPAGCVMVGVEA